MAQARSFIEHALGRLQMALIAPAAGALAILAAGAAVLSLGGGEAEAQPRQTRVNGWQVCNQTSFILEAAHGQPVGNKIRVQGWTRLRPGDCRRIVNAPLTRGTYYLYARSSSAHRGGRRQWTGDAHLCVDASGSFDIESAETCADSYEIRNFRRVRINRREDWRTNFTEPQVAREQSEVARLALNSGIARLLGDIGYDVPEGRGGVPSTARALAQFRAAHRLPESAPSDRLVDALEQAAQNRASSVGLQICNRTNMRAWTAIAWRRAAGWESRGWWRLDGGGCVRVIDDVLNQEDYYIHASLDTSDGERLLRTPGVRFCTSPSRFVITGVRDCDRAYYDEAVFSRVPRRGRLGLVVDLRERSFLPIGQATAELTGVGPAGETLPTSAGSASVNAEAEPTQDRSEDNSPQ